MRWKFDEGLMKKFVRWIKEPKNKEKISDYNQIQKLSEWMKQDKINNAEDKIWAIFLYTCTHDLDSAKKLYAKYRGWKSLDRNWKAGIKEAFRKKEVKCRGHRQRRGQKATIDTMGSYVSFVREHGSQLRFFKSAKKEADPFDYLFRKIKEVRDFGRLSSWDFLERIDRCRVLNFEIKPKRLYLKDATGPKKGFFRIIRCRLSKRELPEAEKRFCKEVRKRLGYKIDIRDIETSLCNWQKRKKRQCS